MMMPQHGRATGRLAAAAAAAATGEREGGEGHCNMNFLTLFLSFALDKFPLSFWRNLACEKRGVKGNNPKESTTTNTNRMKLKMKESGLMEKQAYRVYSLKVIFFFLISLALSSFTHYWYPPFVLFLLLLFSFYNCLLLVSSYSNWLPALLVLYSLRVSSFAPSFCELVLFCWCLVLLLLLLLLLLVLFVILLLLLLLLLLLPLLLLLGFVNKDRAAFSHKRENFLPDP